MNLENICFASKTIDIAENELYLELTNCMCYYDDESLNHVVLCYKDCEEQALEMAKSLINMPVQAHYRKINGKDDLGSHEMTVDENGDVIFLTESVGVHTDVWIEESEVTTVNGDTKVLPCLFSKKRIWKRNKNMINAIKRLYDSDAGLGSSWEIQTIDYNYRNGRKYLTNYLFCSDCLLGSTTCPAYAGTSKAISLSELSEQELMVAEALSLDMSVNEPLEINNNQKKEENLLKKPNMNLSSNENEEINMDNSITEISNTDSETNENTGSNNSIISDNSEEDENDEKPNENNEDDNTDTPDDMTSNDENTGEIEKSEIEKSSLTYWDLRVKITEACREKIGDWCWISFLFPAESVVWISYDEAESELDYLRFTYVVNGDNVTVSEPEKVKLTVVPTEINSVVSEFEKQITEKDNLITTVSAELTKLKSQIVELQPYKEKFEKAEQERIEAEINQKKEDLIASVVKSGQITREEIETSAEMKEWVNTLNKQAFMSVIGERLLSSIENEDKENKEVEVSETKTEPVHASANLNSAADDFIDATSIIRKYVKN